MHTGKMANEILKQVFQEMHSDIATSVNPDSVMDTLFSKKVLGFDDFNKLRQVPVSSDRCRDMMSLLFTSKHPQAFIRLRLALLDDYSWIVDEIDKKLPSLTSQLHQLHLGHSADGKHLLPQIMVSYRKLLNILKQESNVQLRCHQCSATGTDRALISMSPL